MGAITVWIGAVGSWVGAVMAQRALSTAGWAPSPDIWMVFYVGEAPNMVPDDYHSLHNPRDEPGFAV